MRFLLVTSGPHSKLGPQSAERDWWVQTTFEELPNQFDASRVAGILVEVGESAERGLACRWLRGLAKRTRIVVVDGFAGERDIEEWLNAGIDEVLHGPDGALGIMEAMAAPAMKSAAHHLVGVSRPMEDVRERVEMVAKHRCSVLIEGETGTGKEVVARSIHALGDRGKGPWVGVNCAAIPETLLESELFGHVKGAFTGALQGRAGKFEAANGGTIFLDEIGDMPMSIQCKLLRVLQEREVERLGGNERIRLDVRVIAATNSNLEQLVREGKFRQDLYFRLNVVRIPISPLRMRKEDIGGLARVFLRRVCEAEQMPVKQLSREAERALSGYGWPGNVRELENKIEAAVILSGGRRVLLTSDFTFSNLALAAVAPIGPAAETFRIPVGGIDYQKMLEDFELSLLTQALTRARGNKTVAAELLGMKRTTLTAKYRALESRMPRLVA